MTDPDTPSTKTAVTLGEGNTPLLSARGLEHLGVSSLSFKAEYQNPTGSFKDRIAAMGTALIGDRGLNGAIGTSSGNGGAAIAAYGARAGFPVVLFTRAGIVDGKLSQILAHGASVYFIEEDPDRRIDRTAEAIAKLAAEKGWLPFLTGDRFSPDAMVGAETIAHELSEQAPSATAIYVPVGGGGLLGSIARGYGRLGTTAPRLVGVQPEGCPTLSRATAGVLDHLDEPMTTSVSGLQVPVLFDYGAIDAVRDTGGSVVEVTDTEVWSAQKLLAQQEGLFVEPAGAAAFAGLLKDAAAGQVGPDDDVVVILSGAGHKDGEAVVRMSDGNRPKTIAASDIASVFKEHGLS